MLKILFIYGKYLILVHDSYIYHLKRRSRLSISFNENAILVLKSYVYLSKKKSRFS
jgi:hypothetical protein